MNSNNQLQNRLSYRLYREKGTDMEYLIQLYRQRLKQTFRENKPEATKVIECLKNGLITLDEAMEILERIRIEHSKAHDNQL